MSEATTEAFLPRAIQEGWFEVMNTFGKSLKSVIDQARHLPAGYWLVSKSENETEGSNDASL
ncbi:hypothetical protein [Methanosarcina sp.]|uniref:hypothetical protein n=1 Tax=Methanosarcina sp. TaxID=2213 RepID=UPI003BB809F9